MGDPWKIVSFSVYGAMLLSMYLASTLYHGLKGRARAIWCRFDHCAIYLLIAGSYTPFTLVSLRGVWGWWLFGLVWGLALVGIVQELLIGRHTRALSLFIYFLMGWLANISAGPLVTALTLGGLLWLNAGGLVYTLGVIFYALDRKWRPAHGIWHVFVLGGSICHYFTIAFYVA
jgi:hemolysin III